MQKFFIVLLLIGIVFTFEVLIFNLLGRSFLPSLSLILIMFINLSLGIRYGLFVALSLGFLKDSLGIGFFGMHMLSYVIVTFLAVIIQKYIYLRGSGLSRLLLIATMVLVDFIVQFFLNLMSGEVPFVSALRFVFLPELLATLLLTNLCFDYFKKCALRFFV